MPISVFVSRILMHLRFMNFISLKKYISVGSFKASFFLLLEKEKKTFFLHYLEVEIYKILVTAV